MSKQLSLPLPEKDIRPRLKIPHKIIALVKNGKIQYKKGDEKGALETMISVRESLERLEKRITNRRS